MDDKLLRKTKKDISISFNTVIFGLIKTANEKLNDADKKKITKVKRKLRIASRMKKDTIIDACYENILKSRNHIQNCDEEFFITKEKYDIDEKAEDSNLAFDLIRIIKSTFPKLSEEEKTQIWIQIQKLLLESAKYQLNKKQIGDHKQIKKHN